MMNKTLFDFNQNFTLLTPTITSGVNEVNPMIASNNSFSFDDDDLIFSFLSKKNQDLLMKEENTHEISDDIQDYDLFSTFDLPALSELNKSDSQSDDMVLINKHITESSFPSSPGDFHHDSEFSPVDETTTSTNIWVGNECVVESIGDDMTVPSSPLSASSVSSDKMFKKKKGLSPIEKKLRKKDQNKTAAEKYRLKKRTERDELANRHLQLQNQNKELKFELENLTFRLDHFKQLFVDVLKIPISPKKSN